jgi:hypothetical protein
MGLLDVRVLWRMQVVVVSLELGLGIGTGTDANERREDTTDMSEACGYGEVSGTYVTRITCVRMYIWDGVQRRHV